MQWSHLQTSLPSFTSKDFDDFDLATGRPRPVQPIDRLVEEQSAPSYNAWGVELTTMTAYNYATVTNLVGEQQRLRHVSAQ